MIFNYNSEEFQQAFALCNVMVPARHRPPTDVDKMASPQVWGVVRNLAHHDFQGWELWSEWSPVFEALDPGERLMAAEYTAQSWGCPSHTLEAVQHEFNFRVLSTNVASFRAADLSILPPPASPEDVHAWEAQHKLALPLYLRRFFTEISVGHQEPYETWLFNLHDEFFAPFKTIVQTDGFDEEMGDPHDVLARVLHHLLATGDDGPTTFELPEAQEGLLPGQDDETADTLLMMYNYFEGNHGDEAEFLITQGPLAGRLLAWSDMFHSGPNGGLLTYTSFHLTDWLLDAYKEYVLGEDMLAEIKVEGWQL